VPFSTSVRSLPRRFGVVLTSFLQQSGLAFADVLPEDRIQAAFDEQGVAFAQEEDEIYTPPIALWALLSQVLFKEEQRSCAAAVSRVVVLLVVLGRQPPSGNTGAYCRARAKLPVSVIRRLACEVADGCERAVPQQWLWHGRHVKLVDGSTCSMPDTEKNQAEYPHPASQQPGLGFPLARFVVLLSLATAMVSDLAIGPYVGKETGETALLRELLERLNPGDILLADRFYCSYFMICLLVAAKVDFVTRLHQRRTADFRRGTRLGPGDHRVVWSRPPKPDWMDQARYDQMPESICVREVEFCVAQPGFRVGTLIVVTTLTDARRYTRDDLAELYHRRWLAEVYQPECTSSAGLYQLAA
jgi:putative transposase